MCESERERVCVCVEEAVRVGVGEKRREGLSGSIIGRRRTRADGNPHSIERPSDSQALLEARDGEPWMHCTATHRTSCATCRSFARVPALQRALVRTKSPDICISL